MQHPRKKPFKRRITKKAALIITGAAVALAAAFALLLPKPHTPAIVGIPERELTRRTLAQHDAGTLKSITITPSHGEAYTLAYIDGRLMLEGENGLQALRDGASEEIISAVTLITAQDTVAENAEAVADNLADMGLRPPRATALARYSDGREEQLELGYTVHDTTYRYFRWSGGAGVYMCDAGAADALDVPADRLLPVPSPELVMPLIDRVALTSAGGRRIEARFAVNAEGAVSGRIVSPIEYPMSAEAAETVLRAVCDIRLGAPLGEGEADFGFDAPLCAVEAHRREGMRNAIGENGQLVYEALPEASFLFTFGREEGDYYYTCMYEGGAYLVSKLLCRALVEGDALAWTARSPFGMSGELSAITVRTGKGALQARLKYTERVLPNNSLETDSEGNVLYDREATINGEASAGERYDELAAALASITVSGRLDADWSPDGKAPRWSAELESVYGERRVITAYPYDAFSDAIAVDGTALYYLNNEALEIALKELMP